jgi:hypothetical protein
MSFHFHQCKMWSSISCWCLSHSWCSWRNLPMQSYFLIFISIPILFERQITKGCCNQASSSKQFFTIHLNHTLMSKFNATLHWTWKITSFCNPSHSLILKFNTSLHWKGKMTILPCRYFFKHLSSAELTSAKNWRCRKWRLCSWQREEDDKCKTCYEAARDWNSWPHNDLVDSLGGCFPLLIFHVHRLIVIGSIIWSNVDK